LIGTVVVVPLIFVVTALYFWLAAKVTKMPFGFQALVRAHVLDLTTGRDQRRGQRDPAGHEQHSADRSRRVVARCP
jgi:hypothetical protein